MAGWQENCLDCGCFGWAMLPDLHQSQCVGLSYTTDIKKTKQIFTRWVSNHLGLTCFFKELVVSKSDHIKATRFELPHMELGPGHTCIETHLNIQNTQTHIYLYTHTPYGILIYTYIHIYIYIYTYIYI